MKPLTKLISAFIFVFIIQVQGTFGQLATTLKGILINKITGEKLAYASIYCQKDGIGTISNESGEFIFYIPENTKDDTVYISFMGYEKKRILKRTISPDSVYKIYLNPVFIHLKEVTVTAKAKDFNERKIIKQAIKNIPKNYPDFPFQLSGYYRDYVRNGIYYNNLIEAALTVQDKGFKTEDYRNSQIQINQIRKNTAFKTDSFETRLLYGKNKSIPHSVLKDFNGNEFWILRIHDPIRNYNKFSFSFVEVMKSDFLRNHHFHLDSIVYNDNEAFYAISFTNTIYKLPLNNPDIKDSLKENVVFDIKGNLLINKQNYGIYRFNYTMDCKSKDYNGEILKEQLEYKEFNSKLYLNYHLLKNYFEYSEATTFRIYKISLDKTRNCVKVKFTQPIHPRRWKEAQINLLVNGKTVKNINVNPLYDIIEIYYPADDKLMQHINQDNTQQLTVNIINLVSIYKKPLDFQPRSGHFQYREFFTNEIKTGSVIPDSAFASKLVPLYQVEKIVDPKFWNTYNAFLRQPLKE